MKMQDFSISDPLHRVVLNFEIVGASIFVNIVYHLYTRASSRGYHYALDPTPQKYVFGVQDVRAGTNKTDRITRTHGTHKTDRITRTWDRQDRQVRDERQDRQI